MPVPRRSTKSTADPLAAAFVARRHQLGLTQSELALLAASGVRRCSRSNRDRTRFNSTE